MKKEKKMAAILLAMLFILTFVGCVENEDFVVYGRFQHKYTVDEFEVFCDWETIHPWLVECNLEEYGLYPYFHDDNDSFRDDEKIINKIILINYSPNDNNIKYTTPGSAEISYGAQKCNSVESQNHTGARYFTEPMIQIHLFNPKAKKDIEPDYLAGYRAVYSLNGELALEEGVWFLEEDKDEFCRHYFENMLKIIGKGS